MSDEVFFTVFAAEDRGAWDEFVAACDDAWLYHKPSFFVPSLYNVGAERDFTAHSFSIRLTANPARIVGIGVFTLIGNGQGMLLGGPGLALADAAKKKPVLAAIKAALTEFALKRGCAAVKMYFPPVAPGNRNVRYFDSILPKLGFSFGNRDVNFDYVTGFSTNIDLTKDAKEITAGMGPRRRAEVKRCAGLELATVIQRGAELEDRVWADFVAQHCGVAKRNGFPPYTEGQYAALKAMVEDGDMTVANLYQNESCIASILLESYKDAVYYLAGAADDRSRDIGGMSYIHFKAIEWMAAHGMKWYCLGISLAIITETPGLFKRQFGGERWDYLVGELIVDRVAHHRQVKLPDALRGAKLVPPVLFKIRRFVLDRLGR